MAGLIFCRLISRFQSGPIAARFPFVRYSTMSKPRFLYEYLEEVERLEYYRTGGYHPLQIGDHLHQRYRIVHKLGYGSFSTIWLARDEQSSKYVAVKVGTADSDQHEADILSHITHSTFWDRTGRILVSSQPQQDAVFLIPKRHRIPDYSSLMLPGLLQPNLLWLSYIHDQDYAHGDLHLGNILLRLPELDNFSEEQLYDKFGPPEPEPAVRLDGKPLPPGVPSHAFSPVWLGKPSEKIEHSDAKLMLADFGEAFGPSREPRSVSHTPLEIRPPEARFEPTKPLSFASDIWALACSIWAILGQRPLFDSILVTQDDMTCEQVDALGFLPPEWWDKWGARSKKFIEAGQPVEGRSVWSWDQRFEDSIQQPRREKGMATLDAKETDALFTMVRWMLSFKPSDHPSAKQVLETVWMRDWALPAYKKVQE